MMIVDTPGFQNPDMAGGQSRGASFEELCHNYAQERLQALCHERTFVQELERYKEVASGGVRAHPGDLVPCPEVAGSGSALRRPCLACVQGLPPRPPLIFWLILQCLLTETWWIKIQVCVREMGERASSGCPH